MFWIGMIVGVIITFVVSFAYMAWCFKVTGVTYDEYVDMAETVEAAIDNRESRLQAWHSDELLSEAVLEEK